MALVFYPQLMQKASMHLLATHQMKFLKYAFQKRFCSVLSSYMPVASGKNGSNLPDCQFSPSSPCLVTQKMSYSSHIDVRDCLPKMLVQLCSDTQPVRQGSTSGMSGSKTPSLGDVFSDENKERVMSTLSSKRTLRRFYTKDMKQRGAVVVPLCSVNREPCILFTLRTRTLKDHSGEVSFPGGKMDPTDGDICHTALRELQEELGVDPESVEVWGNLAPVGRERITVVPVIGYLGEIDVQALKYNPDEVSSVFVMTLSHLCSPASQAYTIFEPHQYSGQAMATLPVFVGGEHRVWGLTAHILDLALQSIVPDHYRSLVSQVKKEQATFS